MAGKNQQEFKAWDTYVAEAAHDPFKLPISEEETLVIDSPSGAAMLQASRAFRQGDAEAMLFSLCGDNWPRIEDLFSKAPFKAMEELATDLMVFFDLTDEYVLVGPGGGKVTEADPRRIKSLLRAGYVHQGEADASRS